MAFELVDFWRRCNLAAPPYAHPDDMPVLERGNGKHIDVAPMGFDEYVGSSRFGDFDDHRLHLSLLPFPYGGNLATADIFVLLLNPGFALSDYWAETRVPEFKRRLEKNLRQDMDGVEFPFMWLDPEFCWHGGFLWWEKRLRGVISKIAAVRFKDRYLDALRDLSCRIAQLELVPYHSPSFDAHAVIHDLPSARAARRFAQEELLPGASSGTKLLILTRQVKAWGELTSSQNVILYEGAQTRGASLGPGTPGGNAILKRYGIEPT